MLDRILNNLHPAINKDPLSTPAIQINGSGTVFLENDIMQLIGASGSAQLDLRGLTLGSLTTQINAVSGFSATCLAPTSLSALVLTSGTFNLPYTLNMFTSFLWQLLKPVAVAMLDALGAEGKALLEMVLNTSDGSWLDAFGELFGVVREAAEPDSLYATRIFNLSVGVRVNNIAIKKVLADVSYGSDVVDKAGGSFTINITIPTNTPEGFIYSTAQIHNIIDQIRPAGIPYEILSQGAASDTITFSESITTLTATIPFKYNSGRKWGQLTWKN